MNKQNVVIFICIVFGYTVSNARISSHEAGRLRGQYTSATEGEQKEILSTLRSSNYANIADQLELVSSRKDLADKATTLAAQESTLAQQQTQIAQLNQQNQKLAQEKTQLQQKEQAQQAQLKNQETMLAQNKKELQTTQSTLAEKEKNVATLNSQITALKSTISAHEQEKAAFASELKALRAQKETADKELQSLKGGDSEHIKRIGQLERERQELQTQTADLKKKIADAQESTAPLQDKIRKLESELGQKENECDKKIVEASKEHQKILEEFKVKTTDLERQLKAREQDMAIAKQSEKDVIITRNQCMQREQKQDEKIQALKQQVAELEAKSAEIQKNLDQCDTYLEESGQLNKQLEQECTAEISKLKKENDALKTKNQELITELGTAGLVMM